MREIPRIRIMEIGEPRPTAGRQAKPRRCIECGRAQASTLPGCRPERLCVLCKREADRAIRRELEGRR